MEASFFEQPIIPLPLCSGSLQAPLFYSLNNSSCNYDVNEAEMLSKNQEDLLNVSRKNKEDEIKYSEKPHFQVSNQNDSCSRESCLFNTNKYIKIKDKYGKNSEPQEEMSNKIFQLYTDQYKDEISLNQPLENQMINQDQQYLSRYKYYHKYYAKPERIQPQTKETKSILTQHTIFIANYFKQHKQEFQDFKKQVLQDLEYQQIMSHSRAKDNLKCFYRNIKFHKCLKKYFMSYEQLEKDLNSSNIKGNQKKKYRSKWKCLKILFDMQIINPATCQYVNFDNLMQPKKQKYHTRANSNRLPVNNIPLMQKGIDVNRQCSLTNISCD